MTLHEGVECELSEWVSVGPTEERFAIYLLGFRFLGMSVEITDGFHVGRKPFVNMNVKAL
jgi:hypothetical protein